MKYIGLCSAIYSIGDTKYDENEGRIVKILLMMGMNAEDVVDHPCSVYCSDTLKLLYFFCVSQIFLGNWKNPFSKNFKTFSQNDKRKKTEICNSVQI